jgi:hypothetical protein
MGGGGGGAAILRARGGRSGREGRGTSWWCGQGFDLPSAAVGVSSSLFDSVPVHSSGEQQLGEMAQPVICHHCSV